MKGKLVFGMVCAMMFFTFSPSADAQKKTVKAKVGKICGNPQIKCRTGDLTFQAHEIPFEIPAGGNAVIFDSEPFYAVILKTVKLNSRVNCENAISEEERLRIQKLFPDHKVFVLKCSEAGDLYYTNTTNNTNFTAVYAGRTVAEAKKFLKTVQTAGKFKGANIRRTQASINGT